MILCLNRKPETVVQSHTFYPLANMQKRGILAYFPINMRTNGGWITLIQDLSRISPYFAVFGPIFHRKKC